MHLVDWKDDIFHMFCVMPVCIEQAYSGKFSGDRVAIWLSNGLGVALFTLYINY